MSIVHPSEIRPPAPKISTNANPLKIITAAYYLSMWGGHFFTTKAKYKALQRTKIYYIYEKKFLFKDIKYDVLREDPFLFHLGIAQIAIGPPSPHSTGHSGAGPGWATGPIWENSQNHRCGDK